MTAAPPGEPDTRPGPYYVSATDAGRYWLMAGPYQDHAAALADVNRAREIATLHDPRAWWKAWGTCRAEGRTEPGRMNALGLI